jgi:hypothetical protein
MFERSVPSLGKPDCIPITKTSRLTLFIQIITVRCDYDTKHIGSCLEVIVILNIAMQHYILAQFKLTYL